MVIWPWLTMLASVTPEIVSRLAAAMKSAVLMLPVDARKPAVLMRPPAPMNRPDGFKIHTLPLALIVPSITVPGPPMATRFSVIAPALGWANTSVFPDATENCCQSSTARWLVWVMVVVKPSPLVTTLPMVPALTANDGGVIGTASCARAGNPANDSAIGAAAASTAARVRRAKRGGIVLNMAAVPLRTARSR